MTYRTITRVVVTCGCGTLELNSHATSQEAWTFAAAHVALTGKCQPAMFRDEILVPVEQPTVTSRKATVAA